MSSDKVAFCLRMIHTGSRFSLIYGGQRRDQLFQTTIAFTELPLNSAKRLAQHDPRVTVRHAACIRCGGFCLGASVRPSMIELSPGQSTVSEYSSTEVWVRRLNLRRLRENRTGRQTCCNSGEPRRASKPHTSTKFTSTLGLMEQWSEVRAVEFWQPANDNIDAVSVVLDVVYKLRVAHS